MMTQEEIEVKVNEAEAQVKETATTMFDLVRQVVLASVGAVALTFDEVETLVKKLVERGEVAQKDAEKLLRDVRTRLSGTASEQVEQVEERAENSLESLLGRLNIPSKRDIDDLSAKIAQLTVRVEELRKTPTRTVKSENGDK
jgi:poly(hydroxyalkanoate) granule-associated protein